jgi:chemotaxis protein CheD
VKKAILTSEGISFPDEPTEIISMVGSSVAVTIFDRELKIGGVLHFLQPTWNGFGIKNIKYGDVGTEQIIKEFLKKGSKPENLIANIVGGAVIGECGDDIPTGLKNVRSAKKILGNYDVAIDVVEVGKEKSRHIKFHSRTGVLTIN